MSFTNRILVVRPDRLGDVVLSTPVLDAIKHYLPDSKVGLLVREPLAALFESHPGVDWVFPYRPETEHRGVRGIQRLAEKLSEHTFNSALTLQAQLPVSLALSLAGIPIRIGPRSKWFSYVLFNRGLRQSRSQSERNEADYNLELAALLWEKRAPTREEFPVHLELPKGALESATHWLAETGLKKQENGFVAIHPGMGGSAMNWPVEYYENLIAQLIEATVPIVISVGPQDHAVAERLRARFKSAVDDRSIAFFEGKGSDLISFGGVLAQAKVVVAPSTGPLHLAAALGRPVIGFYPPVRVQSPKRWGPYLRSNMPFRVFSPSVTCPGHYRCLEKRCSHFNCMESLTVGDALVEIRKYI